MLVIMIHFKNFVTWIVMSPIENEGHGWQLYDYEIIENALKYLESCVDIKCFWNHVYGSEQ